MTEAIDPTLVNLIIFVLAVFVGYLVLWTVTPALLTPLNVAGGFLVTQRMLEMFKKKQPKGEKREG